MRVRKKYFDNYENKRHPLRINRMKTKLNLLTSGNGYNISTNVPRSGLNISESNSETD